MEKDARIWVAGHSGLVGSAIVRALAEQGFTNIITRSHAVLDLTDQKKLVDFLSLMRPEYVFLAAARVGGIVANNTYPADFIYQNLAIATNVIHWSKVFGVRKLLNLGSSCIYPRLAAQPITEDALLTGPLESTNRAYAVAKIAAIEMCDAYRKQHDCDFISAMPTNVYGPGDNFDLETSHVVPALIRKIMDADYLREEEATLWGTGNVRREFIYVDDLADACIFLMENFSGPGPINVGQGSDLTIRELAAEIVDIMGYDGRIEWDTSRPDGTPRKALDTSKMEALGWRAKTPLREGLLRTIEWYSMNVADYTDYDA